MWQFIWFRYDSCSSFVNGIIFFFSKLIIFVLSWWFTKLFHVIFYSVHIMLIFHTSNCLYCRHWIPTGTMFTYFCFTWFFKIIFTFIYYFNQILKICINNRWCLIRFLLLFTLQHHKNLYFHIFFWEIQVCFLF